MSERFAPKKSEGFLPQKHGMGLSKRKPAASIPFVSDDRKAAMASDNDDMSRETTWNMSGRPDAQQQGTAWVE